MKISLLPLAQAELDEAFTWYEEQAIGLVITFWMNLTKQCDSSHPFPSFMK